MARRVEEYLGQSRREASAVKKERYDQLLTPAQKATIATITQILPVANPKVRILFGIEFSLIGKIVGQRDVNYNLTRESIDLIIVNNGSDVSLMKDSAVQFLGNELFLESGGEVRTVYSSDSFKILEVGTGDVRDRVILNAGKSSDRYALKSANDPADMEHASLGVLKL